MIDWSDKEERKTYDKEYYQKNKQKRLKQSKEHRQRNRQAFIEYKKTLVCSICGESDYVCLDFHHRDPEEKENDLAEMSSSGWSIAKMMEEIEKCDVLCRNCHAKLHAGRFIT